MNTISSKSKSDLLLGTSLNKLHQESREWLDTIAFWKDETKFFANLINEKETRKSEYGKILKRLDRIHENLFDYLAENIINHEKLLSRLVKGEKGLADGDYRKEHNNLSKRMDLFLNDFKDFKKMVFDYVKKL